MSILAAFILGVAIERWRIKRLWEPGDHPES